MTVDVGDGVKEMGWEEGGGEVPLIDEGVGGDTREPTEVIVLFLSSIEQSGGSSKKVTSLSLIGKWEPLVHCIWVENGVGE